VLDPVKVLIGLDRLWVYELAGNSGVLVRELALDHLVGSVQGGFVATVDGVEWLVGRSRGCGCGGNRTWKPFPYRLTMVPLPRR
jgi:hypothetical protein